MIQKSYFWGLHSMKNVPVFLCYFSIIHNSQNMDIANASIKKYTLNNHAKEGNPHFATRWIHHNRFQPILGSCRQHVRLACLTPQILCLTVHLFNSSCMYTSIGRQASSSHDPFEIVIVTWIYILLLSSFCYVIGCSFWDHLIGTVGSFMKIRIWKIVGKHQRHVKWWHSPSCK